MLPLFLDRPSFSIVFLVFTLLLAWCANRFIHSLALRLLQWLPQRLTHSLLIMAVWQPVALFAVSSLFLASNPGAPSIAKLLTLALLSFALAAAIAYAASFPLPPSQEVFVASKAIGALSMPLALLKGYSSAFAVVALPLSLAAEQGKAHASESGEMP